MADSAWVARYKQQLDAYMHCQEFRCWVRGGNTLEAISCSNCNKTSRGVKAFIHFYEENCNNGCSLFASNQTKKKYVYENLKKKFIVLCKHCFNRQYEIIEVKLVTWRIFDEQLVFSRINTT